MASTKYLQGTFIKVQSQFMNVNNVPIDPTVVTLRYKKPDQTITVLATTDVSSLITKVSAGVYTAEITLDTPGKWVFRWEGSGNNGAVSETSVQVTESQILD